jgi:hypothetical protein
MGNRVRNVWSICSMLSTVLLYAAQMCAQSPSTPQRERPLVLTGAIPLPNVQGRIDHLGFDPKGRLFVSALGNNSEEILDLSAGIRSHSIAGIMNPRRCCWKGSRKSENRGRLCTASRRSSNVRRWRQLEDSHEPTQHPPTEP